MDQPCNLLYDSFPLASCLQGSVVTGGGYSLLTNDPSSGSDLPVALYNAPRTGQSWMVELLDLDKNGAIVYAVCAHVE
jgi:hypothetical protein